MNYLGPTPDANPQNSDILEQRATNDNFGSTQSLRPLISVVMATYNGELYLEEQLRSIIGQSYTNFELIIVDDCSTDGTRDILARYQAQDKRIRCVMNAINAGANPTFEQALRLTQGDLVAISDQDDIWRPNKLETLFNNIGDYDCIYTDSLLIDDLGNQLSRTLLQSLRVRKPVADQRTLSLITKNSIAGHAVLIRKNVVDMAIPLIPSEHIFYDHQLALIATLNRGIVYFDQPLTSHRIHGRNLVHDTLGTATPPKNGRVNRPSTMGSRIIKTIDFINTHVEKYARHYEGKPDVLTKVNRLNSIKERLTHLQNSYFDMQLFFQLLLVRDEWFASSGRSPISNCFSLAKGARWNAR